MHIRTGCSTLAGLIDLHQATMHPEATCLEAEVGVALTPKGVVVEGSLEAVDLEALQIEVDNGEELT